MGKLASIYLTDEEVAELRKFCNENQCSQYSALKTALRELLSKSIKTTQEAEAMQKGSEASKSTSKNDKKDSLSLWLRKLASK